MTMLAAQPSTWDKVRGVPAQAWLNLVICVLAVVLVTRVWKALKKFNDFAPWFAAALAASMILAYWVYERTEPRFLTPFVEKLALLLPTKAKQEQALQKMRESRER